jgi:hypothetical protein
MGAIRFGPAVVPWRESPAAAVELLLEHGYSACEVASRCTPRSQPFSVSLSAAGSTATGIAPVIIPSRSGFGAPPGAQDLRWPSFGVVRLCMRLDSEGERSTQRFSAPGVNDRRDRRVTRSTAAAASSSTERRPCAVRCRSGPSRNGTISRIARRSAYGGAFAIPRWGPSAATAQSDLSNHAKASVWAAISHGDPAFTSMPRFVPAELGPQRRRARLGRALRCEDLLAVTSRPPGAEATRC